MGSVYNGNIKLSLFGESHGDAIGIVIDGMPSGIKLDYDFIDSEMDRRKPKDHNISTTREENDKVSILSGVLNKKTTGSPIAAIIENKNIKSSDYSDFKFRPRPSHSDYTALLRYKKCNDMSGGGHFSGRLTAPLVFAGSIVKIALKQRYDVLVASHIKCIHGVEDKTEKPIYNLMYEDFIKNYTKIMPVFNDKSLEKMINIIKTAKKNNDSVGGVVSAIAFNMPAGFGDPHFDSIESKVSSALFAVPAVKGVEFGLGFEFANAYGSECNDVFNFDAKKKKIKTITNYNGGINGGISNGMPITVNVVIKPTPSIAKEQITLNTKTKKMESLVIHGRHDPCILSRAPVVIEAMFAASLLDTCIAMKGVF